MIALPGGRRHARTDRGREIPEITHHPLAGATRGTIGLDERPMLNEGAMAEFANGP